MTRTDFRRRLLSCLGGAWPEAGPLNPVVRGPPQAAAGYRIEHVAYDSEPGDPVPACLLIPDQVSASRPAPAIAVWHQHAGQWHLGKSEPAGLAGDPVHHTGAALARAGYVVLCPDALCFEDRRDPTGRLEGGDFERFEFLRYTVAGKCMAWKNILDMRRAVDYLVSRPEVDARAIGSYGHSMGSTHAWLGAPWDERLRAVVCNCCLPTYAGIHREHLLHCFPNFIPGLHAFGDTPDVVALIAPRPLHLNFGELDDGSPIDEVRRAVARLARTYARQHAAERFSVYIEDGTGHTLSAGMWQRTRAWFDRWLRTP
jgi:dienelactone hydrolase